MYSDSLKAKIKKLTKEILTDDWKKKNSDKNTKSLGIQDAESVIKDFLEDREYICAFEHLEYVISETETRLTVEHAQKMEKMGLALKMK